MGREVIMLPTDSYCPAGKTALLGYNTGNQGLVVELFMLWKVYKPNRASSLEFYAWSCWRSTRHRHMPRCMSDPNVYRFGPKICPQVRSKLRTIRSSSDYGPGWPTHPPTVAKRRSTQHRSPVASPTLNTFPSIRGRWTLSIDTKKSYYDNMPKDNNICNIEKIIS